ncbi:helix-turn-helix domain-containing protein [Tunicatimonas pelagia]|uniref:helix-turn-helix domain-containing protein n=1 Tax=Tunicatimonas pelagia TaxID=931531 RepID=UPI002666B01E|nr:helix-turn-helix transcriptional regulator [Tunicatimonas pelagia]WKN44137.1 helix-turn-helix transcriptional regulator [Tunicatimonas pelagia]
MTNFITIASVSQLHNLLGFGKPKHPLITVIDYSKISSLPEWVNVRIVSDFYTVTLKTPSPVGLLYGRQPFDFDSGTMIFTAPSQVIYVSEDNSEVQFSGWGLWFHPELIRRTKLSDTIRQHEFFKYAINEALHVSNEEEQMLSLVLRNIECELLSGIDQFSQSVLVTAIEQLLNYTQRYYSRQFATRNNQNVDYFSRFEKLLDTYLNSDNLPSNGLPDVKFFADQLNLSPGYLTEILKRETGKTAKEIILLELVEKAKLMLLNSSQTISEISFQLGFENPSYFSRLFRKKVGMAPLEFRGLN